MAFFRSSTALILGLAGLIFSARSADAFVVVSSGINTFTMTPSADTLTLSAASVVASFGTFTLQNGTFTVGNSGTLTGTFLFNITENITINGETHPLVLSARDIVGLNNDTLTIFASTPLVFSNANLTLTTFLFNLATTAQTSAISLQGSLVSMPEPSALSLFGASCAGLAVALRRRGRSPVRSS
jgi:hypothetical protein